MAQQPDVLLDDELIGGDPNLCLIGSDEDDRPFYWELDYVPACHILIAGQTGGGKGGTLTTILTHHLAIGSEVIIIQPKPGEFGAFEGAASLVSSPTGWVNAMRYVDERRRERMEARVQHVDPETGIRGVRTVFNLPNPPHRILLVIDETPQVLSPAALIHFARSKEAGKRYLEDATAYTSTQLATGRSEGIMIVMVAQNPTLEGMFGTNAAAHPLRLNLTARILCDRNPQSLRAMFESGYRVRDEALSLLGDGAPGRVAYGFLQEKDRGDVRIGQVLWLEPHEVKPFADSYSGPPPQDFD